LITEGSGIVEIGEIFVETDAESSDSISISTNFNLISTSLSGGVIEHELEELILVYFLLLIVFFVFPLKFIL
jgi:hypothetical protein